MTNEQRENLANVINAAIERYPVENIAEIFMEQITGWKDKQKVATALQIDSDFTDEFMYCLDEYKMSADSVDKCIKIAETKGRFIKTDSLAQEIRVNEFLEYLAANPYQLKLIA